MLNPFVMNYPLYVVTGLQISMRQENDATVARYIAMARHRRFRSNCKPNRRLGIDDLGGAPFGIDNRNHHDRKSLFYRGPGS